MRAFLTLIFIALCFVTLNDYYYTCGIRRYGYKDDDYYEEFYIRKIPKLKVSHAKVKEFFTNHLSWFPAEDLKGRNVREEALLAEPKGRVYKSVFHDSGYDKFGHVNVEEGNTTTKHGSKTNSSMLGQYMGKVINQSDIQNKIKNLTHPFRPKCQSKHTTMLRYLTTTTTTTPSTTPYNIKLMTGPQSLELTFPTYGKTAAALVHRQKSRLSIKRPRKVKVYIDVENRRKTERHAKPAYNGTEANNSSHVLVTAEEMANDLAGRVSNLWKCVVTGSHRTPQIRDVKYFLYTRRNIIQAEELAVNYNLIENMSSAAKKGDVECAELNAADIDDFLRISDENRDIIRSNFLSLRAPTKILIHGYTGSYRDNRMAKIKDAYLSLGRYNVIQVDWEGLAAPPCYIRVTHHSRFVGKTVAKFIDGLFLIGLNMSLVHVVGFSLGAQVAGLAGNLVTFGKICRITGLDPALPLFLHTDSAGHLDKYDADFVDVIHTCGGILAMPDPVGHVDFYPNGGSRQPGCEFSNLKCSHSRAPQYFAESVSAEKKFKAQMCSSWETYLAGSCNASTAVSYMGEPCSIKSEPGKYYLTTKSKEPFSC